jgi:hypothetical protein
VATINVQINLQYTIPKLTGASVDSVLAWLTANVTNQLPSGGTATIMFTNMTP